MPQDERQPDAPEPTGWRPSDVGSKESTVPSLRNVLAERWSRLLHGKMWINILVGAAATVLLSRGSGLKGWFWVVGAVFIVTVLLQLIDSALGKRHEAVLEHSRKELFTEAVKRQVALSKGASSILPRLSVNSKDDADKVANELVVALNILWFGLPGVRVTAYRLGDGGQTLNVLATSNESRDRLEPANLGLSTAAGYLLLRVAKEGFKYGAIERELGSFPDLIDGFDDASEQLAAVPLFIENTRYGLLVVDTGSGTEITNWELESIRLIAAMISTTIDAGHQAHGPEDGKPSSEGGSE